MIKPILQGAALALVLLTAPAALQGQQQNADTLAPALPAPEQPSPEVQGWLMEMQQLQQQLAPIQAQALEDSALLVSQQELGTEIKAAVEAADPGLNERIEQLQDAEAELAAAQQNGDSTKLQALAQDALEVQQRFIAAQQQALQQPQITAKVETFQTELEQKMIEVDPEAATLIQRFRELEDKLEAAMRASQPG